MYIGNSGLSIDQTITVLGGLDAVELTFQDERGKLIALGVVDHGHGHASRQHIVTGRRREVHAEESAIAAFLRLHRTFRIGRVCWCAVEEESSLDLFQHNGVEAHGLSAHLDEEVSPGVLAVRIIMLVPSALGIELEQVARQLEGERAAIAVFTAFAGFQRAIQRHAAELAID